MTSRPRPGLAIFDCDGTLVDSQHVIVACMHAAFSGEGLTLPDAAAVRQVIGLPLEECMARLAPAEESVCHGRLVDHYKDTFVTIRQNPANHEPLFDGARETIDALDEAGFVLGIATGKARRGLLAVLDRLALTHRFATIQTSDVAPGKPHPAMLERAMAETGFEPADTVMIGDTTFDMLMARSARAAAIAVGWGYHPVAELRAAGAHMVVENFTELSARLCEHRWRNQCA
jgi:phosphoglycolate phosphatase